MKPRVAISLCVVAFILGFALGTEFQKKSSLAVSPSELPYLQIDRAIYHDALARSQDAAAKRHIQSQLNIIELNIARAEGR
ncbi:MAG: hypothetical protein Fues2KO_32160 [Fuerstiella sp.]